MNYFENNKDGGGIFGAPDLTFTGFPQGINGGAYNPHPQVDAGCNLEVNLMIWKAHIKELQYQTKIMQGVK